MAPWGTGSGTTAPGGRQHATLWADASGNIWLFGGFGLDSAGTGSPEGAILNDLWKFNTSTKLWTWGFRGRHYRVSLTKGGRTGRKPLRPPEMFPAHAGVRWAGLTQTATSSSSAAGVTALAPTRAPDS